MQDCHLLSSCTKFQHIACILTQTKIHWHCLVCSLHNLDISLCLRFSMILNMDTFSNFFPGSLCPMAQQGDGDSDWDLVCMVMLGSRWISVYVSSGIGCLWVTMMFNMSSFSSLSLIINFPYRSSPSTVANPWMNPVSMQYRVDQSSSISFCSTTMSE